MMDTHWHSCNRSGKTINVNRVGRNTRGGDGELTWPLREAVRRQDLGLVRLLMSHGARSQRPKPSRQSEMHLLAKLQKQGPPLIKVRYPFSLLSQTCLLTIGVKMAATVVGLERWD